MGAQQVKDAKQSNVKQKPDKSVQRTIKDSKLLGSDIFNDAADGMLFNFFGSFLVLFKLTKIYNVYCLLLIANLQFIVDIDR